jgi:hypothetical protein
MPASAKDGSSQSIQAVGQTSTIKSAEKDQDSSVDKLLGFVSNFGLVKVSALNSNSWGTGGVTWYYWWIYLNGNLVQDFKLLFAAGATIATIIPIVALFFGPVSPFIAGGYALLAAYLMWYNAWLDWASSTCNGNGAYLSGQLYIAQPALWVSRTC